MRKTGRICYKSSYKNPWARAWSSRFGKSNNAQGCGSGSPWIRIIFRSCIQIRIPIMREWSWIRIWILIKVITNKLRSFRGSKWGRVGSVDKKGADSIKRSRIRIRIKVKSWIPISIKVKSWIRMRIHNHGKRKGQYRELFAAKECEDEKGTKDE